MFKNAVETLNYFAEQCKAFEPIKEEFVNLKVENAKLKETNESTVKELSEAKIESIAIKDQNMMLIKELADTKLMLLDIQNKLNGGK